MKKPKKHLLVTRGLRYETLCGRRGRFNAYGSWRRVTCLRCKALKGSKKEKELR